MTPTSGRLLAGDAPQIELTKNEASRLAQRIREDYNGAIADHDLRMRRFQRYYQLWRKRADVPLLGEEETSNFRVPIVQWQTFSKWAKEHSALFGADAEVVATAVGPDDQKRVRKVARFMTWRAFRSMRLQNKASVFNFRKILFGRAHARSTWLRETFDIPTGGGRQTGIHYDGPGFDPLWPDDLIVPAEDVATLQDFSFVLEKTRRTPDQLLKGEDEGRYQGIRDRWEDILSFAANKKRRDEDQLVQQIKDLAEGVTYEGSWAAANTLIVWEWYGRWRRLKGKRDAREDNYKQRDEYESDLLVRYIPVLDLVVGAQDLAEMYPLTKQRRPFMEAALVQDGSYWSPGFGEMLEDLEDELSVNHNLATQGGQFSVGPVVFYKPSSGFNPDTFEYRPNMCVATEDPNGVKVLDFKADLSPSVIRNQELVTYGERVTGQTDANIGRSTDRPNAPRTARQTLALLEEGDVRASLETSALREHWGDILSWFWSLEQMYGSPRTFFRVTEEEAGGMFPTARGGTFLDEDDKTGRYDFDLRFATSATARESKKEEQIALYQIDSQNPLIVGNPVLGLPPNRRAMWLSLDKIHRAFGDDRFSEIIPEPPDLDQPKKPVDEWTMMLEHEHVDVNPLDNDQAHIADHTQRLMDAMTDPNTDEDAVKAMELHIVDHTRQMQQKKLMGELTARLAQSLTQPGGLVTGQPSTTLANAHAAIGAMIQPQPQPGAQPGAQPQPGGLAA